VDDGLIDECLIYEYLVRKKSDILDEDVMTRMIEKE